LRGRCKAVPGRRRAQGAPGSTGQSALAANSRAVCLRLNMRMVSAVGPRNAMPRASHASTKSTFSLRKPYPGCTAQHLRARARPAGFGAAPRSCCALGVPRPERGAPAGFSASPCSCCGRALGAFRPEPLTASCGAIFHTASRDGARHVVQHPVSRTAPHGAAGLPTRTLGKRSWACAAGAQACRPRTRARRRR